VAGALHLHGWYFDRTAGALLHDQPENQGSPSTWKATIQDAISRLKIALSGSGIFVSPRTLI
jgi:hypothetical protein